MNVKMRSEVDSPNITIASGSATSAEFIIGGMTYFTLFMPSNVQGSTATFLAAKETGGDFLSLYDDNNAEVSIAFGASRAIGIDTACMKLAGVQYAKLRLGTSASPSPATSEIVIGTSLKG